MASIKPAPPANSLSKFASLPIPKGLEYNVCTYKLNHELIEDGYVNTGVQELYGIVWSFGSFVTYNQAIKHKDKLIEVTGYNIFFIVKYGKPLPLKLTHDPKIVKPVYVDIKNTIIK